MGHKVALICLNGHIISGNIEYSYNDQNYCQECGLETVNSCINCGSLIRGDLDYGIGYEILHSAPNHCYNCGKAYPWFEAKVNAAKELAEEMDDLTEEEINKLKLSIDDLIIEGPRTKLAATRFKKVLPKAGREVANGMRDILVDIASETAKKVLFP